MPSWELFAAQDDAYRDAVLPPGLPARGRRGRRLAGLGALGRPRGRDRPLRGQRAGRPGPREARDHGREHRAGRARAAGRADAPSGRCATDARADGVLGATTSGCTGRGPGPGVRIERAGLVDRLRLRAESLPHRSGPSQEGHAPDPRRQGRWAGLSEPVAVDQGHEAQLRQGQPPVPRAGQRHARAPGRRAGRDRGDADAARRDAGGLHPQCQHHHLARLRLPVLLAPGLRLRSLPVHAPRLRRQGADRGEVDHQHRLAARSGPAPVSGARRGRPPRGHLRRGAAGGRQVCARMVAIDPQPRTLTNPAASPDGRHLVAVAEPWVDNSDFTQTFRGRSRCSTRRRASSCAT